MSKYIIGEKVKTISEWNNGQGKIIPKGSIVTILEDNEMYKYCVCDYEGFRAIYDYEWLGEIINEIKFDYRLTKRMIVKHFKRELVSEESNEYLYKILDFAKHIETGETLVIYKALYEPYEIYARPLKDFMSKVDKTKYPNIKQKYRFEEYKRVE